MDSDDDDDDNFDYEKRALIDETGDDDINLFSANPYEVRQRNSKNKSPNNNELHELNAINGTKRQRDLMSEPIVEYAYYDIKPGDTLHSICLRYSCPSSQIKRINGLMHDQEFHGLKRIKLPRGKLGLLEEVLTCQQPSASPTQDRQKIVISPGSALSVSTYHGAKFKPLLSPGFSSDRINEMSKHSRNGLTNSGEQASPNGKPHHSHSFSSLRDFAYSEAGHDQVNNNTDIQNLSPPKPIYVDTRQLQQHAFIKTHFDTDIDDPNLIDHLPSTTNGKVEKVFEDLDYHVEKAKEAAERYDQRASEIVSHIDADGSPSTAIVGQRVSKIPDLFFCNENFGLSYKKLIVFILVVCLIVPLVYINQAKIVTT